MNFIRHPLPWSSGNTLQGDDILCRFRWRHLEPFFRVRFRGQSLVMGVNHGRGVASLLSGLVFVGVRGKVVGAKGVPQAVGDPGDFGGIAERGQMLLEGDFMARPEFPGLFVVA